MWERMGGMGVYAGGGSRSRRARPKNGPKLLCRGGGPADAAQQAVSRGVRKCDSLAQAAGLPQRLAQAPGFRRGVGGDGHVGSSTPEYPRFRMQRMHKGTRRDFLRQSTDLTLFPSGSAFKSGLPSNAKKL